MPSALKPKSAPKQLSTKFYADMLNLEIKIQAHDYTFKNIDELVQLYAVLTMIIVTIFSNFRLIASSRIL